MKKHIQFPHKTSKNYATYDRAVKAAEKASNGLYTFVILAGTGENEGRFVPAFLGAEANDMMFLGFPWIVKG